VDTMDLLTALIHKPSVTVLVRNTAQETAWEEVPVLTMSANASQVTLV